MTRVKIRNNEGKSPKYGWLGRDLKDMCCSLVVTDDGVNAITPWQDIEIIGEFDR